MGIFSTLIIGILKQVTTKGLTKLWENKDMLSLYRKTLFGRYRNKEIRFSISYLFRIQIPDTNSYLLVMNRKILNQLQPVGGAYKRYGDDKFFESWEHQHDKISNGLGVDEKSSKDLRFFVKGKYVIKVIKWFEESKERETSAHREFIEELIETGIVDKEIFRKLSYRHLKRVSKNLKWSDFHNCYEVLIYDIFEFIPTDEQKIFLTNLKNEGSNLEKGFAIVECEEIEQLRLRKENIQIAKIGEHTKLIINKNF